MRTGIDLVEIKRISRSNKIFNENEIKYAQTRKNEQETLAGIFAAKEAFLKAIGIGIFNGIKLSDIVVSHDINGVPQLFISNEIKKKFKIKKTNVSISHDLNFAIAICNIF